MYHESIDAHAQFRFSVLVGPINHIKHLVSKDRLPFSAVYFGSLGLTLYFSLGVCITILDLDYVLTFLGCQAHSWLGSLVSGVVQVCHDERVVRSSFIFVMTGGCSRFVCASVLPRRDTDAAHGWLISPTGRWKSFTQVVVYVLTKLNV